MSYAQLMHLSIKNTAVFVLACIATCIGVYFASAPSVQHRAAAQFQDALLKSIEQGDGTLELDQVFGANDLNFYSSHDSIQVLTADKIQEGKFLTGIGVLSIDRIHMQLPVTEGISDTQLTVSVGHVPQTPPIGTLGNAVIAGHRSYVYGHLFNRLGEIVLGDRIEYRPKDGNSIGFIVDEVIKILPDDKIAFKQPDDTVQITLYTCTPIHTATHRLIIRASLITEE